MPDKDGNTLPPLPDEVFDGAKESKQLEFTKCKHNMNFISPTEIRCTKCSIGYTGTSREVNDLKKLFDNL